CSEYFDTLKVDGANHGSKVRYRILTQALPDTHHTATIFFFLTLKLLNRIFPLFLQHALKKVQ
ncbi:hypothetical protein, partial [Corynebacterium coyleae]|uniref:hypothetical protein n=1 Tax=Corynebacterium coyleae TaxID=53374 RepID=UPI001ADA4CEC